MRAKKQFTALKADPSPTVWRCYSCGNTDGFSQRFYDTYYGYEYECVCNKCGSDNTNEDGEGTPECENCGTLDWFCNKCTLNMCEECWKWFPVAVEPMENICPKCEGSNDAATNYPK